MAAALNKLQIVQHILSVAGPQAARVTNRQALTPLQQVQSDTQNTNEFFEAMISGIPRPSIEKSKCLIMLELSKAAGKAITLLRLVKKLGQCLNGLHLWLLPGRMVEPSYEVPLTWYELIIINLSQYANMLL